MAGKGELDLCKDAVVEFHNPIARAAEGAMMAPRIVVRDFEPRPAIAKGAAVDQAQALNYDHGTIERGRMASWLAAGFGNLLRSGRAL